MSSSFSGDLKLTEEVGHPFFVVSDDLRFECPKLKVTVTVRKGERTDLYSVPKPLRGMVSAMQKSAIPAVLHDHAYRKQIFGRKGRKYADKLLLSAMQQINAEAIKAGNGRLFSRSRMAAIYGGVRLGGWAAYNKHKIT